MSELRYDPIKQRWTIIAEERKMRPREFTIPLAGQREHEAQDSLFTHGKEHLVPPEIMAIPRIHPPASGPNWQVRVVPDRFPVLRVEGQVEREGEGIYDRVRAVGAHEVIVENPDPNREMADLEVDELVLLFRAFQARMLDLRRDIRLRYILIFKNRGREAGASINHPHCQLIATPIIPTFVIHELQAAREHYQHKERCIFCDLIHQEQLLGKRIALETGRYVAINPFASAFPFETWILPKRHQHDFAQAADDELRGFAAILRDLLRRIRVLLLDPAYNLVLHSAPCPHPRPGHPAYWSTIEQDFHWHLELAPRITTIAGFEWGSGFTINPTPPEEAARFLNEADPEGGG
jgi:UDPglucose--hexose-1-phosphate uridylyltransferase